MPFLLIAFLMALAGILAYCAWSGQRSGAIAQLLTLGTLVLCYLVAGLIAWSGIAIPGLHVIPLTLQPFVYGAVAAVILYILLSVWTRRKLRQIDAAAVRRAEAAGAEKPEQQRPSAAPWNRRWGVVVGALKGGLISAVLLLIAHFIGQAALLTESVMQEREKAGEPPDQRSLVQKLARQFGEEVNTTPLVSPVAEAIAPVKAEDFKRLHKLTRLMDNEAAMERFRENPKIREMMNLPAIRRLSEDKRIAKMIEQKRWFELLDQPAIAALARDADLQRQVLAINFEQILDDALTAQPARLQTTPPPFVPTPGGMPFNGPGGNRPPGSVPGALSPPSGLTPQ